MRPPPSKQFAYELEDNGVLPFLDTEVIHHPDGSLSTKIYMKKTHTGKYLDFQSHHPLAHKLAVLRQVSPKIVFQPNGQS